MLLDLSSMTLSPFGAHTTMGATLILCVVEVVESSSSPKLKILPIGACNSRYLYDMSMLGLLVACPMYGASFGTLSSPWLFLFIAWKPRIVCLWLKTLHNPNKQTLPHRK